jgi:hypothetical protein
MRQILFPFSCDSYCYRDAATIMSAFKHDVHKKWFSWVFWSEFMCVFVNVVMYAIQLKFNKHKNVKISQFVAMSSEITHASCYKNVKNLHSNNNFLWKWFLWKIGHLTWEILIFNASLHICLELSKLDRNALIHKIAITICKYPWFIT